MIRLVIYLFPVVVNCIVGGVFFFGADSFSRAGQGGLLVGCTIAVWSLIYSGVSWLMGRIVTEKNSALFIMIGSLLLAACSLGFLLFPALFLQFLWISLCGVGAALYCTSFQVFMKSLEPDQNQGVVRSAALYTCSWSIGLATGALIFGGLSARAAFSLSIVAALGLAGGVWAVARYAAKHPARRSEKAVSAVVCDYSSRPDLAWLGWLCGGAGTFAVTVIRAMEPFRGAALGFPKAETGLALALVSYVQAVTALGLLRSRTWMYRPARMLLIGGFGVTGLLLFSFGDALSAFYLAAVCYGIFSGCMYFYFVFYSLVHPTKSGRYVAVNEFVVGLMGIIGPVTGGLFAGRERSWLPFLVCAVLLTATTLFHAAVLKKDQNKVI